MTILETIILGLIEGFTEFLPISSTAHLIITSRLLGLEPSAFLSSFIIAIQLGAIASVIALYAKKVLFDLDLIVRIMCAFIPTAIVGFLLYQLIKDVLIESLPVIATALILGGIVFIIFEHWRGPDIETEEIAPMTRRQAFFIGIAQSLAVVPGVSRAGATIIGGMMLGVKRPQIVEFSFLLAVPTMIAATAYDLYKTGGVIATDQWQLLILGFLVSFIAAWLSVSAVVKFVQTHTFTIFGIYRIILGSIILLVTALA